MRFITAVLFALVIAVAGTPADAGGRKDAKRLCKSELRADYKADDFSGVTVVKKRSGVYKVEGYAERKKRRDNWFSCKVRDRRITKIKMDDWKKDKGGSADAGEVLGALIGVAILGAIASDYENDDYYKNENSAATSPEFRKNWGNSYSPRNGITCFRGQRACYKEGKGYNAKWTDREFGGYR